VITEVTRIRGRELQRRRERLFEKQRWCVTCLNHDRRTLATIRRHIVPLVEGGTEDESNEQALCLDCSDAKTEHESRRGVPRSRMTDRFRKSATPRDRGGQFTRRRAIPGQGGSILQEGGHRETAPVVRAKDVSK
jgi:5-methylcytosine-specific restriction endonuclease McrA